jgi:hypothetical protein
VAAVETTLRRLWFVAGALISAALDPPSLGGVVEAEVAVAEAANSNGWAASGPAAPAGRKAGSALAGWFVAGAAWVGSGVSAAGNGVSPDAERLWFNRSKGTRRP